MTVYNAVIQNIQEIRSKIDELEKIHPYKEVGNPDSYSSYNEGWCDALNAIEGYISSIENKVRILSKI